MNTVKINTIRDRLWDEHLILFHYQDDQVIRRHCPAGGSGFVTETLPARFNKNIARAIALDAHRVLGPNEQLAGHLK